MVRTDSTCFNEAGLDNKPVNEYTEPDQFGFIEPKWRKDGWDHECKWRCSSRDRRTRHAFVLPDWLHPNGVRGSGNCNGAYKMGCNRSQYS